MPDRSYDVRSQGVEWTSQLRPPTSEFDPTQDIRVGLSYHLVGQVSGGAR